MADRLGVKPMGRNAGTVPSGTAFPDEWPNEAVTVYLHPPCPILPFAIFEADWRVSFPPVRKDQ